MLGNAVPLFYTIKKMRKLLERFDLSSLEKFYNTAIDAC